MTTLVNLKPTDTLSGFKKVLNEWIEKLGIPRRKYETRVYFNNNTQLSPVVFGTTDYDGMTFQSHSSLIEGGVITIDSIEPRKINLGYMAVSDGTWEDDNIGLDPNEYVIPKTLVKIFYTYPFTGEFLYMHCSVDKKGFTRKDISEGIMTRYHEMYRDPEKYGIWGHDIDDLRLHTMIENADGSFNLGLDS